MNKVVLVGRLARDPELRAVASGVNVCNFTVAVDRRFKNAQGERQADFVPVVAWRQQAELVGKYFQKGSRIGVAGSIQTRKYEAKDGTTRYVTEVLADEIEFMESRAEAELRRGGGGRYAAPGYDDAPPAYGQPAAPQGYSQPAAAPAQDKSFEDALPDFASLDDELPF